MKTPVRALLITAGTEHRQPWWWTEIDHDASRCQLDHVTLLIEGGRLKKLLSLKSLSLFVQMVVLLFKARRRYDYIYTFECSWLSFAAAFIQTVCFQRRPRHVILQFIMREKLPTLKSRLKYAFMRFCFSSVYLCICSSRSEIRYYQSAFNWPSSKLAFVPLHTASCWVASDPGPEGSYMIAAGRTFRDYATLLAAFEAIDVPLVIVAGRSNGITSTRPNIRILYDVPQDELSGLLTGSMAIVLPLEERQISIGQMVLLQSMALAKPVVVTRVNGTEDYVDQMRTGILVPPRDALAIRDAVLRLHQDPSLRVRLGQAARDRIRDAHLPRHYAEAVSVCLRNRRTAENRRSNGGVEVAVAIEQTGRGTHDGE